MKAINIAAIAQAACNVSMCEGRALTIPMAEDIRQIVVRQMREQLAQHNVHTVVNTINGDALLAPIRGSIIQAISDTETALKEAELPARFYRRLDRIKETIKEDKYNGDVVAALLQELIYDLLDELSEPKFFYVAKDHRHLFETEAPFGAAVAETFHDANKDILAAARCLALDEWTACVFHLMRVLELGLRSVAEMVGLPAEQTTSENWKNIIDQIEKRIRSIESEPKSTEKREKLRVYSGAAVQFRYFKDAWRNHVSHSRAHYDLKEAESIWNHVKTFLEQLAHHQEK